MREKLIGMLRAMEDRIPPPANCHHALTYARYGNDEGGWTEQLALQVNQAGKFTCFFLDDADLEKDPESLSLEVAAMLANPDPRTQFGVAFGQYVPAPDEGEKV